MSFTLIETPAESLPKHPVSYYAWETDVEHYFKGCNSQMVFPFAMNLYLGKCSEEELNLLLDHKHFLRLSFYENSKEKKSCISGIVLDIDGYNDDGCKQLLRSCPNDMVPCEILMGPFWHLLWMDRSMCEMRHIMIMVGSELVGRDAFPFETEEMMKEMEEGDGIFIIRPN